MIPSCARRWAPAREKRRGCGDPNFEFPVRILVNGQERKGVARGNDWFVPVRAGEVHEIQVENRSGRVVCMRLFVDGLNTLPEREKDTKGIATMAWSKRVKLDEARHHVLDPARSKVFSVRGFITDTGPEGKLKQFTVTDADKSLAARLQLTDQIGLITAAFYAPAQGRGPLGTEAGKEQSEELTERAGIRVGNLLAVVHIRYVDARELEAAQ